MRRLGGWGLAISALLHLALLAGLAWSLRTRFTQPRAQPIEVQLVPRSIPARAARPAEQPDRPRPRAAARPADAPAAEPLPLPAVAPRTVAEDRPVEPAADPPRPLYRGLGGCTDDPAAEPGRPPCFTAETGQAALPAFVIGGERRAQWDQEVARRRPRKTEPFVECPTDSPQSNLGFSCLPK